MRPSATVRWERKPLGAVAELCLGKMLDQAKNRGELLPYLANVNVRWGEFSLDALRTMRFEQKEVERFGLRFGDIVMCEGGEPGRCAIWKNQVSGMMIQKALHRIRPSRDLDHRFLFYSFLQMGRSNGFDRFFTGSTIKHLPLEKLTRIEVDVPPLTMQRRIADVLSAYDELIENSQRRIRILETMARALYREWFVHFRFPGHENVPRVTSPLGAIPKGWSTTTLRAVTTKIGSGATPRGGKDAYKGGGVRLIRSLNVYDYVFELADLASINELQAADLDNVIVEENDVLLNITGASVARSCLVPAHLLPARVNQHVAIVRADPTKIGPFYLLDAINSDDRKAQLLAYAQGGATREALTKDTISNFEVVLPPRTMLERYEAVAGPIHRQREALQRQSQNLHRTRDLLLPRLMSGQIDLGTVDVRREMGVVIRFPASQTLELVSQDREEVVEACLIGGLLRSLAMPGYPAGRVRYTKLAYLAHRKAGDNVVALYKKNAAGPYNPRSRYDAEPIAIQRGYLRLLDGKSDRFLPGPRIDEVTRELPRYPSCQQIEWLRENFQGMNTDRLEVLTTVDFATFDVVADRKAVNLNTIKGILQSTPEWRPKLERSVFSDANIASALDELRRLFSKCPAYARQPREN